MRVIGFSRVEQVGPWINCGKLPILGRRVSPTINLFAWREQVVRDCLLQWLASAVWTALCADLQWGWCQVFHFGDGWAYGEQERILMIAESDGVTWIDVELTIAHTFVADKCPALRVQVRKYRLVGIDYGNAAVVVRHRLVIYSDVTEGVSSDRYDPLLDLKSFKFGLEEGERYRRLLHHRHRKFSEHSSIGLQRPVATCDRSPLFKPLGSNQNKIVALH